MKSLLVLGNGFDINCGLNSKFDDFFKTKLGNAREAADTYNNTICTNFWYLLLYFAFYDDNTRVYQQTQYVIKRIHNNDVLWMDVECFIKKIVSTKKEDDKWMKNHLPYMVDDYPSYFTYLYNRRHDSYAKGEKNQASAIMKHFLRITINNFNIYTYLYDELVKFENDFKEYIKSQIDLCKQYVDTCRNIFSELINFSSEQFSVITFNYTKSLGFVAEPFEGDMAHDYYNIHGSLTDNIIIGFDSSDIENNTFYGIKLSKSWQKMNTSKDTFNLPEKNTIEAIKFYGHSLGPQDYSYFHALFDYYDIYERNVTLYFYYTEYGNNEEKNQIIRSNYVSSVYKLLTDYASKSGSEEKVTTIISRLHLENRLRIKTISSFRKTK